MYFISEAELELTKPSDKGAKGSEPSPPTKLSSLSYVYDQRNRRYRRPNPNHGGLGPIQSGTGSPFYTFSISMFNVFCCSIFRIRLTRFRLRGNELLLVLTAEAPLILLRTWINSTIPSRYFILIQWVANVQQFRHLEVQTVYSWRHTMLPRSSDGMCGNFGLLKG